MDINKKFELITKQLVLEKEKKHLELESLPVETLSEFPTVVEIIKAGYSEHCGDMLDTMFAEGPQTIH